MTCLKHNKPIRAYFHPELHFCCEDCERENLEVMFSDLISNLEEASSSLNRITDKLNEIKLLLKIIQEKKENQREDAEALIANIEKKLKEAQNEKQDKQDR